MAHEFEDSRNDIASSSPAWLQSETLSQKTKQTKHPYPPKLEMFNFFFFLTAWGTARQVLYHSNHTPNPFVFSLFFR
jgi:hypothetical protein